MSLWMRLVDALVTVETLEDDAGMLCFGETVEAGGLLVEQRHVCWAIAPGMQQRLRELFDAYGDDRRAALRRHTAESLLRLCERDEVPHWAQRPGKGFSPQFSFAPIEVLLAAVAVRWPDEQAAAASALPVLASGERRAAAFIADPMRTQPVPLASAGATTVQELAELGGWAAALLRAARELGTVPAFTLASTSAGDALLVWVRDSILYVIADHDRAGLASLATTQLSEVAA